MYIFENNKVIQVTRAQLKKVAGINMSTSFTTLITRIKSRLNQAMGTLYILSGIIFINNMFLFAPWNINTNDFILKPFLSFSLPAFLTGLVLYKTRNTYVNILPIITIIYCLFVILLTINVWPSQGHSTSWEDSYQTLFILETILTYRGLPLWVATLLSIFYYNYLSLRKI